MNPGRLLFFICAAIALMGCTAPVVKVTEIRPERSGFEITAHDAKAPLTRYISDAEGAWRKLDHDPADVAARRDYNLAVGRIVAELRETKASPLKMPLGIGTRTPTWQHNRNPERDPALYELIPADHLDIRGPYVNERQIKDGLGAPLVAKRIADQLHEHAPTPHFFYNVTAVARFEGSRCVLSLEYPLKTETVQVGRHTFPLAADYTAPLAMMAEEMHPEKLGMPRLLHPAKFADTTRIARLEPFDPNKTVVLVVHGLMSSPATWIPLINHLRADTEIRRHYQFWLFSYPTGYPYSYSAALLRNELERTEKQYPLWKKMVVIGHSMGGCISRLLITDSGTRIWDQMFSVPPEQMNLSPEHQHVLTGSAIFHHRQEIGRVIFISSPLRGADLAGGWLGRIGARFVRLPADLVSLGKEEARFARQVEGHRHLDRFPDSVDTLSPDNEFVRALGTVPIKQGIPYHVIAGDRGKGNAPHSSDGLVPYWSSHLPDAKSEKIVPSHHNAQQHPQAIEEIHRILMLHRNSPPLP